MNDQPSDFSISMDGPHQQRKRRNGCSVLSVQPASAWQCPKAASERSKRAMTARGSMGLKSY